jgi:signal transduction histidine kinase
MEALSMSPSAAVAVAQIIQESVANAVTHGTATMVIIRCQQLTPRTLRVEINDNGTFQSSASSAGLGTILLNEVTSHWSLTTNEMGTVLRADIPLSL